MFKKKVHWYFKVALQSVTSKVQSPYRRINTQFIVKEWVVEKKCEYRHKGEQR